MKCFFELIKREARRTQEIVIAFMIVSILVMQQSSTLEKVKSQILMVEAFIFGWMIFVLISSFYFFIKDDK